MIGQVSNSIKHTLTFLDTVKTQLTIDGVLGAVVVREQCKSTLRMLVTTGHLHQFAPQAHSVKRELEELISRANQVAMAIPRIRLQDSAYFESK